MHWVCFISPTRLYLAASLFRWHDHRYSSRKGATRRSIAYQLQSFCSRTWYHRGSCGKHILQKPYSRRYILTLKSQTGSAHAYLTGYYVNSPLTTKLLPKKFAGSLLTTVLNGTQLSKRGGRLICIWDDGKVKLVGKAWEFGRGTLSTPQA